MSGFEVLLPAIGQAVGATLFGVPEVMGAAATTGGLLGGVSLGSLLGAGLSGYGALQSISGNPAAGTPALLAAKMMGGQGPTSTVSAGPAVRTPDYSSIANAYSIAPGMVNELIGGRGETPTQLSPTMPPYLNLGTMSGAPPGIPGGPTPQQPSQTQAPSGIGSWDVYKSMQERALKQAEINKPFAIAPGIRPGPPVPVTVGKPLAGGSPLHKYAAMLQGLR